MEDAQPSQETQDRGRHHVVQLAHDTQTSVLERAGG
jgi:hypothetical protein